MIPSIDLGYAGKIPSSSGLANESEISIADDKKSERLQVSSYLSIDKLNVGGSTTAL